MKKILAIVLALVTVLSLCACGGPSGASSGEELTADGRVKLTIGVPSSALVLDYNNNELTNYVEEKCGVELEFIEFAGGTDVPTQISTRIAARVALPDMLYGVELGETTVTQYGNEGYLLDQRPYYDDKEGASKVFWDRFTTVLSEYDQDRIWRAMVEAGSDAIYATPFIETGMVDYWHSMAWINTEWLDIINMDKPTNCDELLAVLRAFKKTDCNGNGRADELPLVGNSGTSDTSNVLSWLVNMFCFYQPSRPWFLREDGTVDFVYIQDEYRQALAFINQLYKEGLMVDPWNTTQNNVKMYATPNDGVPISGIFIGHLTTYTVPDNMLIEKYEPLITWGTTVKTGDATYRTHFYITGDCAESKRDKAFEVMMATMDWEGSMRARYGVKGVNWDMPDSEGIITNYGLEANWKLLKDVFGTPNNCSWVSAPMINEYCEYETAQLTEELSAYAKLKLEMHVELVNEYQKIWEEKKPDNYLPAIKATIEEKEKSDAAINNVNTMRANADYEFITGVRNPNDKNAWAQYIQELKDVGLETYRTYLQTAYDRDYK